MKKCKLALLCLVLALCLILTACSGSKDKEPAKTTETKAANTVNVCLCAPFVNDSSLNAVQEALGKLVPEGIAVKVSGISTGSDADPTLQMAGIMKVSATMASGEIDLFIADESNGARNARGDAFTALSNIFTEEELTALGDRALAFAVLDDDGNETAETTAAFGVDITGNDTFTASMGTGSIGAYIIDGCPGIENAKLLLKALAA